MMHYRYPFLCQKSVFYRWSWDLEHNCTWQKNDISYLLHRHPFQRGYISKGSTIIFFE